MPRRYRCHPLLKLPPTSRRVLHAYAQMQGWHVIPMGTFLGAQRMDAYQPDRWPRMSLMDGCAWTRQLDMLGPTNFFACSPLMYPYMEIICASRPKTLQHVHVFSIWKEEP